MTAYKYNRNPHHSHSPSLDSVQHFLIFLELGNTELDAVSDFTHSSWLKSPSYSLAPQLKGA